MAESLSCEILLEYLSDYIDRELDEELTAAARQHLATCPHCKVVLDTTQKTIFLLRQNQTRRIPARHRQRLFERLERAFVERARQR